MAFLRRSASPGAALAAGQRRPAAVRAGHDSAAVAGGAGALLSAELGGGRNLPPRPAALDVPDARPDPGGRRIGDGVRARLAVVAHGADAADAGRLAPRP